jgi:hypothetical protein
MERIRSISLRLKTLHQIMRDLTDEDPIDAGRAYATQTDIAATLDELIAAVQLVPESDRNGEIWIQAMEQSQIAMSVIAQAVMTCLLGRAEMIGGTNYYGRALSDARKLFQKAQGKT